MNVMRLWSARYTSAHRTEPPLRSTRESPITRLEKRIARTKQPSLRTAAGEG